jgi:hypothetical protein
MFQAKRMKEYTPDPNKLRKLQKMRAEDMIYIRRKSKQQKGALSEE